MDNPIRRKSGNEPFPPPALPEIDVQAIIGNYLNRLSPELRRDYEIMHMHGNEFLDAFCHRFFASANAFLERGELPPIDDTMSGRACFRYPSLFTGDLAWPVCPAPSGGRADFCRWECGSLRLLAQVRRLWLAQPNSDGKVDYCQSKDADAMKLLTGVIQYVCMNKAAGICLPRLRVSNEPDAYGVIFCFVTDSPPHCDFNMEQVDDLVENMMRDWQEWRTVKTSFCATFPGVSDPLRLQCRAYGRVWSWLEVDTDFRPC